MKSDLTNPKFSPLPYYLLTFLASLIEIGIPIYFLYHNAPLTFIALFAALYHLGYLIKDQIRVNSSGFHINVALLIASLFLLTFSMATENIYLLGFSLPLSTALMQMIRSLYKKVVKTSSASKNIARVLGFAAAGICAFSYYVISIIGLVFALLITILPLEIEKIKKPEAQFNGQKDRPYELKSLLFFEFLHHAHYFMYCYFLVALLYLRFGVPWELLGILFLVGWIGYGVDAARISSFKVSYAVLGHLLCSVCITLIALSENLGQVLGLWFLTGIGGGTAYILDFATPLRADGSEREIYENLGHVTGPLLALLVLLVLDLGFVYIIAGLLCFVAAITIASPKIIDLTLKRTTLTESENRNEED